jgi:transcriptional regulator with XRE-family HTH domain
MRYYAIAMQQYSAKLARDLKAYMREHGERQSEIAEKAGIDQGTVSRFLNQKKPPQRVTEAHRKLCNYATRVLSSADRQEGKEDAQKAFDECWGRSEAHATAISKIINAFVELCRRDRGEDKPS